jgi:hypothetical protein
LFFGGTFYPDDAGDLFIRYVGAHLLDYTAWHPIT